MDPEEFYDLCQQCRRLATAKEEGPSACRSMDVDDVGKCSSSRKVSSSGPGGGGQEQEATAAALDMVFASLDYRSFCRLMRKKAKQYVQAEDDAADMGL